MNWGHWNTLLRSGNGSNFWHSVLQQWETNVIVGQIVASGAKIIVCPTVTSYYIATVTLHATFVFYLSNLSDLSPLTVPLSSVYE